MQPQHMVFGVVGVVLLLAGLHIGTNQGAKTKPVDTTPATVTATSSAGACGPQANKDCYQYGYAVGYAVVSQNIADGDDTDDVTTIMPSACAGAAHDLAESLTESDREAFSNGCLASVNDAISGTNPPADPLPASAEDGTGT